MKKMLLFILFFLFVISAFSKDYPKANFGSYGIQKHSTLEGYQQYVGQTVRYIPLYISSGDWCDAEFFEYKKGKYEKDYVIFKITGNDDRLIFTLKEKEGKTKIKMKVNNNLRYPDSYFSEDFCITKEHSIPLLLIDKLNKDKVEYIGKIYSDSIETIEIQDITFDYDYDSKTRYLSYKLYNKNDKEIYFSNVNNISELDIIGTQLKDSMFKCVYTVINVRKNKEKYPNQGTYTEYTVRNSINKEVKQIRSLKKAFSSDGSKIWTANLTKVEKPLNPDVRYGKTEIITENNLTKYSYVDNYIDILIFISDQDKFAFSLTNISDNSIKIIWNDAVFVDVDGTISKVMHEGIKYSEKEKDQPATTIIKGAKIIDLAVPTSNVYYDEGSKYRSAEWRIRGIFRNAVKNENKKNQVLKLMLPIQVKDVINEYTFEFEVKKVYERPELLVNPEL